MTESIVSLVQAAEANAIATWSVCATALTGLGTIAVAVIAVSQDRKHRKEEARAADADLRQRQIMTSIALRHALDSLHAAVVVGGANHFQPFDGLRHMNAALATLRTALDRDVGHVGLYQLAIQVHALAIRLADVIERHVRNGMVPNRADFDRETMEEREDLGGCRAELAHLRTILNLPNPDLD